MLSICRGMTLEQEGFIKRFIDLSILEGGSLPKDIELLSRKLGILSSDCQRFVNESSHVLSTTRSRIFIKEIKEEVTQSLEKRKLASDKAKKAAKARWDAPSNAPSNAEIRVKSKNKSIYKEKEKPKKRKKDAPRDFKINEAQEEKCKTYGIKPSNITQEFLDYHTSKGNQFADWSRAFNTWMSNKIKFENLTPVQQANTRVEAKEHQLQAL